MSGFLGVAPIYVNGLLAILFVFVLPGLVLVRALDIPNFPQRWFIIFLSSLTLNHFLVTLVAALHFDPLQTYRAVTAALIAALLVMMARKRAAVSTPDTSGASIVLLSDVKWLAGSLVVLGFTYFNVWKHGVPNIFQGSDVSVSWNVWALIWSQGLFPVSSYGYPQFVPTIWATTYIFTGSTAQYFAYYTYIVLIIAPIALCTTVLARVSWRYAASLLFVFAWFVAEIQEPWLRSTLQEGFPDWIAAIFAFCGVMLFVANSPEGRYDKEQMTAALISLSLLSIAAATKPQYGLFTAAILIKICVDAARYLQRDQRTRLIAVAVGLVSAFAAAYMLYYMHLAAHRMPDNPLPASERLPHALKLLTNFTWPFRILAFAGFAMVPFVRSVRWLALPLILGFLFWAKMLSYDLRNLLGLLLISAAIPLCVVTRRFATTAVTSNERRWRVRDATVAAGVGVLCVVLTLPLAMGDERLKQRFADEQLSKGLGIELNRPIAELLGRGCGIFSADGYIHTVSAFQPYRSQMEFFHYTLPLTDLLEKQLNESTGCLSIMYPPGRTHPSILAVIEATAAARGLAKVVDHNGMVLLAPGR